MSGRRRVPARVLVLVLVGAALLGARLGPGVAAAFVSHAGASTGTLTFATLTASFATGTDDLGAAGGVGGSSYTMTVTALPLAGLTHRYTTLTATGSVTETITGTLTATGLTGTMTVAVDACSVAWAAGLCGGTTTSLLAATSVSPAPAVSYGSLAVGAARNLRFTYTATSVSASATVTATAVPTGSGTGNRTAG